MMLGQPQMRSALEILFAAPQALGSGLADIIRTLFYVMDIGLWEEMGSVRAEMVGTVREDLDRSNSHRSDRQRGGIRIRSECGS